ncbi:sulfotransferase family protein [Gracilibacillus massiliensis]|uniref:sulfotransferase family protein n=1 Tax=Gracilibacillus massiliensis TaxID=1564956 RepID=UPI00071DBA69|nr:sulfotransferase [Gracilibacillus massiliensis]
MIVNICCCGSSGSTLLSHLLNRHPEMVCGEELSIFSNNKMYEKFNLVRDNFDFIMNKSLPDFPYSPFPNQPGKQILTSYSTYNMNYSDLKNWILQANTFIDFTFHIKEHILNMTNKKIWVEKTPENIMAVGNFLNHFNGDNVKVIHIVRDPRDVILSLMKRGYTFTNSAERWLSSVSFIQKYRNDDRVLEIRYEDLVNSPNIILEKICEFIDTKFHNDYFYSDRYESKNIKRESGLKSWDNNPKAKISKNSIKKFQNSSIDFNILKKLIVTKEFSSLVDINQYSLIELANLYGYEFE